MRERVNKLLMRLPELAARLYARPTVYRFVWTAIQLGAGAAVAVLADDPKLGIAVTLTATILTSIAREKLAARRAPDEG